MCWENCWAGSYTSSRSEHFSRAQHGDLRRCGPFEVSWAECIVLCSKLSWFPAAPAGWFVSFVSIALPGMIDIRLFYILSVVLFGFNATYVGSAEAMPFYLIAAGDLVRLIWVHPKWPFVDTGSVVANGCFWWGSGIVCEACCFEAQILEGGMMGRVAREPKFLASISGSCPRQLRRPQSRFPA